MAGMAFAGLILLLTDVPSLVRAGRHEEILLFYRKRYYWGMLLILSGLMVFLFCPKPVPEPVIVHAQEPAPEPEPPRIIVFPDLKVDGIVLNGARSSAMINGTPVLLGEGIRGAKIIAITETNITIEVSGERKDIPVRKQGS